MIPVCRRSGLSHEQNVAKMRLLTFMGMAVEFKEISFDTMQQELQIGADDVEAFVIDGTNALASYGINATDWIISEHLLSDNTPPIFSPLPSCSYQDGVLQNRPDAEESCCEVRTFIKKLCMD